MSDESRNERGGEIPETVTPPDLGEAMITPPQETVFRLLSDDCRRETCHYLATATETVHELPDLAEAVAQRVDSEPEGLTITLHHTHLPKLDRAGLVDYDPRSRTVRYRGQPSLEKWAAEARLEARRNAATDD